MMNVLLKGLKIKSIATALPETKLTIKKLCEQFGRNEVERIAVSTGISSLSVADPSVKASDLCMCAAEQIFSHGESKADIGAIVFVSQTPDYIMPASSCIIQHKLGLSEDVAAFDINYGCSGYIYGLYQAALLICSGSCKKVLVCVGDVITRYINPSDHKVKMVLGDAGSATVVMAGSDNWAFDIHTDGSGFDKLIIPKKANGNDGSIIMDGSAVMEFALKVVHKTVGAVLAAKDWEKEEIKYYFLHQANKFMLDYLRKKMRLNREQVPIAVENYGNVGPASIPLTICHHFADKAEQLERSVLSGFGVGLSWGAVALDLTGVQVYEPIFFQTDIQSIKRRVVA